MLHCDRKNEGARREKEEGMKVKRIGLETKRQVDLVRNLFT